MTIQRFIVENNEPNEDAIKLLFAEAVRDAFIDFKKGE